MPECKESFSQSESSADIALLQSTTPASTTWVEDDKDDDGDGVGEEIEEQEVEREDGTWRGVEEEIEGVESVSVSNPREPFKNELSAEEEGGRSEEDHCEMFMEEPGNDVAAINPLVLTTEKKVKFSEVDHVMECPMDEEEEEEDDEKSDEGSEEAVESHDGDMESDVHDDTGSEGSVEVEDDMKGVREEKSRDSQEAGASIEDQTSDIELSGASDQSSSTETEEKEKSQNEEEEEEQNEEWNDDEDVGKDYGKSTAREIDQIGRASCRERV